MTLRGFRGLLMSCLVGVSACGGSTSAPLTEVRDASADECPAGGVVVVNGTDDDGNGELGADEIASRAPICNGEDGDAALIRTRDEPAGAACVAGGVRIDVGTDADADGVLDDAEISSTEFLCEAVATLVATSVEDPGDACGGGGIRIESGLDLDGDRVLDAVEVSSSEVTCHGSDGESVAIRIDAIEPGDDGCETGGRWVHVGIDENGNGALGDDEIAQSSRLCDAGYAALVATDPEPAGVACPAGGVQLHDGLDVDGDGLLGEDEIANTTLLCNGAEASIASYMTTLRDPLDLIGFGGGAIARADLPSGQVLAVGRNGLAGPVIFERAQAGDPWVQVATLPAAFRQDSLAFAGATLLAGAPEDTTAGAKGAVYVYERGATWTQTSTIYNPLVSDSYFGSAVFAEGDRFIVAGGGNPHRTHVYERPPAGSWALSSTITLAGASSAAGLHGNVLALRGYGRVYIHDLVPATNTWANTATVETDGGGFYAVSSVALGDELLVLGVPTYPLGGDVGAALVYERIGGTWQQQAALRPAQGTSTGVGVAIVDRRVAFTSTTSHFGGTRSLFIAEETPLATWQPKQELVSPDRLPDGFGSMLYMDDNEIWATAAAAVHGFDLR